MRIIKIENIQCINFPWVTRIFYMYMYLKPSRFVPPLYEAYLHVLIMNTWRDQAVIDAIKFDIHVDIRRAGNFNMKHFFQTHLTSKIV